MQKNKKWARELPAVDLEDEVQRHNSLYWEKNAPEIEDEVYDVLVERLRAHKPDSRHLQVNDFLSSSRRKVKHAFPMLSLEKTYEVAGARKWIETSTPDRRAFVSYKIDGLALSLRYGTDGELAVAVTRGNGEVGDDVTENALQVEGIPYRYIPGSEVRGEVYLPVSVFEGAFAEEYSNPRNLAAGLMKQSDPNRVAEAGLSFLAYSARYPSLDPRWTFEDTLTDLQQSGFGIGHGRRVSVENVEEVIAELSAAQGSLDYEVDGLVLRVLGEADYLNAGSTSHHPKGALAFKFQGESAETTLERVVWEVSRSGSINPVAELSPVELSGAVITRASLHNLAIMSQISGAPVGLGVVGPHPLSEGARGVVTRRGGVIPHVEEVVASGAGVLVVPNACPDCGALTDMSGDFLVAHHREDCESQGVARLNHFVTVLDIQGFGPKVLQQLWDAALVRKPYHLFELGPGDLINLERFGERKAQKLVEEIQAHRRVRVRDFLRALGIPELGNKVSKDLETLFAKVNDPVGSMVNRAATRRLQPQLVCVEGIGDRIAEQVSSGLHRHETTIHRLLEYVDVYIDDEPEVVAGGALSGKSFLFTGAMESMARKDAEALVKQHGGTVASGVSAALDFLVLGDKDMPRYEGGWRSSKLKKAESLSGQVAIISETVFLEMVS